MNARAASFAYSVEDIAEIFGVSKMTIYRRTEAGELDYLGPWKIGRSIRFSSKCVDAFLDQFAATNPVKK